MRSPPRQHPGHAVGLVRGDQLEFGERGGQLTRRRPKRARRATDLAERADREQPVWRQSPDDHPVEATVPEPVADDDVRRWTVRQTLIKINDVEPAAIADAASPGQIPRVTDGNRRDVESVDVRCDERATRWLAPPAGQVQSMPGRREQILEAGEHRGQTDRSQLRRAAAGVDLVPANTIFLGHSTTPIVLCPFLFGESHHARGGVVVTRDRRTPGEHWSPRRPNLPLTPT